MKKLALLISAGGLLAGTLALPAYADHDTHSRYTDRGYSGQYRYSGDDRYSRQYGYSDRYAQYDYRPRRRDLDGDGIPNRYDRDRDGDGVPNRWDRYPNNPRWY
jgi:hypothetical protein